MLRCEELVAKFKADEAVRREGAAAVAAAVDFQNNVSTGVFSRTDCESVYSRRACFYASNIDAEGRDTKVYDVPLSTKNQPIL